MANLKAVLEAAGGSFNNVVKTTVLLADMSDFAAVNEVYGTIDLSVFILVCMVAFRLGHQGGVRACSFPKSSSVEALDRDGLCMLPL